MILAVTNQKGGVGKTTTCLNLGAIAARDGKRTCLIDLDPQGNLTKTFLDLKASHLTAYDLLNYSTPFREAVMPIGDNLSLVPAQISLSRIERLRADDPALPYRLKEKLAGYAETFDLIILDTPPTLGALTVNAMTAATHLLLPIQASYYCLQGTNDLMETYRLVKAKLNPALKLLGILITMYDPRTTLAKEVVAEIRSVFAGQVLSTIIRRCVKLEESPVSAQSVVTYAPKSIAAEEYQAVYEELMGRVKNHA